LGINDNEEAPLSHVRVDRDVCGSHGLCAATAPQFFELDDDDIAVIKGNPSPDDVRDEIDACPTQAIITVD
jgi:ferredoxin